MSARYQKGQRVIVRIVKNYKLPSVRDSAIEQYQGQSGTVTNFYGINPSSTDATYLYSVLMEKNAKVIAFYEDELRPYIE
jgi:ribosomal protein L21E